MADEMKLDQSAVRQALRGNGREKGSIGCCSVCGKPESRDHIGINVGVHAEARAKKLLQAKANLVKALQIPSLNEPRKTEWNAQLAWIDGKLTEARQQHDDYKPGEGVTASDLANETIAKLTAEVERLTAENTALKAEIAEYTSQGE